MPPSRDTSCYCPCVLLPFSIKTSSSWTESFPSWTKISCQLLQFAPSKLAAGLSSCTLLPWAVCFACAPPFQPSALLSESSVDVVATERGLPLLLSSGRSNMCVWATSV
ncbi:hypothetical protein VIGAN_04148800 [Vigna angularis var. angularis]|uniref:Uncharacterized protein n=1 Tax=Vigna angularis var. angularis TaxID=157739 RepID=A0A0S3RUF5_PHAAN|nr:hypothetical protein VIGAN_04148800 [Vigna angularis var. angularis]